MTDDFFVEDAPHGLVKRIMYKKYLQAFIPITQQAKDPIGRQLYTTAIVDGFAGAGRYGHDWPAEIEQYGSPMIALMVSLNYFYKKLHGKEKIWGISSSERDGDADIEDMVATMSLSGTASDDKPKIQLFFIEKEAVYFDRLKDNIAGVLENFFPNPDASYTEEEIDNRNYQFIITNQNYPIVCHLVNQEFTNVNPPDVISSDSVKCLVFLDPFGFSQTPITHVEKFVGHGNALLINFMSSFVNRFIGVQPENIKKLYGMEYLYEKAAEINIPRESLDEYIGYLVRQFQGSGPLNNIQKCTVTYERMLKEVFGTNMSLTFEMRGVNNSIIYHLIFVTDHIKDIEIMKEAMNCCSQVEGALRMSDYNFCRNGRVLNLGNTQDVNAVANSIYEKFAGCSRMTVSEVKGYVLLSTPYVFRKKCLAVLEKEPTPRLENVIDAQNQRPRRRGTYPDDTIWYLTFRPSEGIVDLASSIYNQYCFDGNGIVHLHDIRERFVFDDFTENALLVMATEKSPRCAIYYINIENDKPVPRNVHVFSSDRAWYIAFRRPASEVIDQFTGQKMVIPGQINTPPPQYKRVVF